MILENPFCKNYFKVIQSSLTSEYQLNKLKNNDKNTWQGDLMHEPILTKLANCFDKILSPIQNFVVIESEKHINLYKRQVLLIQAIHESILFLNGDEIKLDEGSILLTKKDDCLKITDYSFILAYNNIYRYFMED